MTPRIPPMTTPVAGEGDDEDARPINSLWYRYLQALQKQIPAAGIPDAPDDGQQYGRQSGAWTQIVATGPGAPINSFQFNDNGVFRGAANLTYVGGQTAMASGSVMFPSLAIQNDLSTGLGQFNGLGTFGIAVGGLQAWRSQVVGGTNTQTIFTGTDGVITVNYRNPSDIGLLIDVNETGSATNRRAAIGIGKWGIVQDPYLDNTSKLGFWDSDYGATEYWPFVLPEAKGGGIVVDQNPLLLYQSVAAYASLRIPHGVAPTAPVNGDVWTTTAGVFARINGATVGPFGSASVGGSSGQVQWNNGGAFAGIANVTANATNFTAVGLDGTMTFAGLARRLRADISAATSEPNRWAIQNSNANAGSYPGLLPSGTATDCAFIYYNASSAVNCGYVSFGIDNTTTYLFSSRIGSGTSLPFVFACGNTNTRRATIFTNGNWRFGSSTTDPGFAFQVDGEAVFASSNPIRTGSATLIRSTVAFTNGAGANIGTLTNSPVTGNPTKWIPINDNGTTRYIPAW